MTLALTVATASTPKDLLAGMQATQANGGAALAHGGDFACALDGAVQGASLAAGKTAPAFFALATATPAGAPQPAGQQIVSTSAPMLAALVGTSTASTPGPLHKPGVNGSAILVKGMQGSGTATPAAALTQQAPAAGAVGGQATADSTGSGMPRWQRIRRLLAEGPAPTSLMGQVFATGGAIAAQQQGGKTAPLNAGGRPISGPSLATFTARAVAGSPASRFVAPAAAMSGVGQNGAQAVSPAMATSGSGVTAAVPQSGATRTGSASPIPIAQMGQTSTAPANASAIPMQTSTAPANASAIPAQTSTAPANASAIPMQTPTALANASAIPMQTPTAPANASAIPAQVLAAPANASAIPTQTPMASMFSASVPPAATMSRSVPTTQITMPVGVARSAGDPAVTQPQSAPVDGRAVAASGRPRLLNVQDIAVAHQVLNRARSQAATDAPPIMARFGMAIRDGRPATGNVAMAIGGPAIQPASDARSLATRSAPGISGQANNGAQAQPHAATLAVSVSTATLAASAPASHPAGSLAAPQAQERGTVSPFGPAPAGALGTPPSLTTAPSGPLVPPLMANSVVERRQQGRVVSSVTPAPASSPPAAPPVLPGGVAPLASLDLAARQGRPTPRQAAAAGIGAPSLPADHSRPQPSTETAHQQPTGDLGALAVLPPATPSANPTGSTDAAVPTALPTLTSDIVKQVSLHLSGSQHEFRMVLQPANLGTVQVRVQIDNATVRVDLIATTDQTLSTLRTDIASLHRALANDSGLTPQITINSSATMPSFPASPASPLPLPGGTHAGSLGDSGLSNGAFTQQQGDPRANQPDWQQSAPVPLRSPIAPERTAAPTRQPHPQPTGRLDVWA